MYTSYEYAYFVCLFYFGPRLITHRLCTRYSLWLAFCCDFCVCVLFFAASKIKDRLNYETENNVTILVNKVATDPDKAEVLGRGELQVIFFFFFL